MTRATLSGWDQLPGEPADAYARFSAWLFGPRRTPRSRRLIDPLLRDRWGWLQRAALWDQHVAAQRAELERALDGDLVRARIDAFRSVARTQQLIAGRIESLEVGTLDIRELRDLSLIARRSIETAASLETITAPDLASDSSPGAGAVTGAMIPVSELSEEERERLAERIVAERF